VGHKLVLQDGLEDKVNLVDILAGAIGNSVHGGTVAGDRPVDEEAHIQMVSSLEVLGEQCKFGLDKLKALKLLVDIQTGATDTD
jgi:hypothetical protein